MIEWPSNQHSTKLGTKHRWRYPKFSSFVRHNPRPARIMLRLIMTERLRMRHIGWSEWWVGSDFFRENFVRVVQSAALNAFGTLNGRNNREKLVMSRNRGRMSRVGRPSWEAKMRCLCIVCTALLVVLNHDSRTLLIVRNNVDGLYPISVATYSLTSTVWWLLHQLFPVSIVSGLVFFVVFRSAFIATKLFKISWSPIQRLFYTLIHPLDAFLIRFSPLSLLPGLVFVAYFSLLLSLLHSSCSVINSPTRRPPSAKSRRSNLGSYLPRK